MNPLSVNGTITLTWNYMVLLPSNVTCTVNTYMSFNTDVCLFNFLTRTLTIQNVFPANGYIGPVTIGLSSLTNPTTNRQLDPMVIRTFDDKSMQYPADILSYPPKLRCDYPCQDCGGTSSQCTACWQNDLMTNLMITPLKATC
jgi:hypothetical protein